MILNMVYGGESGGASIDAASGSSLPATVVNDQVYIITSTTPGTIYIDTDTLPSVVNIPCAQPVTGGVNAYVPTATATA